MAELGAAAIGVGAALGAAAYTVAHGFAARHESNHSLQASETRRNIADFEAAYEKGEVSEEDWQNYLTIRTDACNREYEYNNSIEAYKETPLYLFIGKWKKKRQVQKKKKALRNANRSLKKHFYEVTLESSDTSSIVASSGSPARSESVHSGEDNKRILSWAEDVASSDSEGESRVTKFNGEGPLTDPLEHVSQSAKVNGVNGLPAEGLDSSQLSSGSHIPTGPNPSTRAGGGSTTLNSLAAPSTQYQEEDISTILVIGLPDDIQEREFQNIFTFASGFETATLNNPNKEYTPFGTNTPASGLANPSTFTPGGNTMASLLAHDSGNSGKFFGGAGAGPKIPFHKQIIGFARFHTREEAVCARDQLHGRCVDVFKGIVVKAEMAKKDLHSKREFSPVDGRLANAAYIDPTFAAITTNDIPPNSTDDKFALKEMNYNATSCEQDFHVGYRFADTFISPYILLHEKACEHFEPRVIPKLLKKDNWEVRDSNKAQKRRGNKVQKGRGDTTKYSTPSSAFPSWKYSTDISSLTPPSVHWGYVNAAINKNPSPAVGENQSNITPQLPVPSSGASTITSASGPSTITPSKADPNSPTNTLHIGNLPTLPLPSPYALNALEDSLHDLFNKQRGYQQMVFIQESNGPMCFVKFEDTQFATKTLNELYGQTLNGLVNGGVRLSYSKSPLSVRTPLT